MKPLKCTGVLNNKRYLKIVLDICWTGSTEVLFMEELICPNCGTKITIDKSAYTELLNQVRNKEFEKELKARESELEKSNETAIRLARSEAEKDFNDRVAEKNNIILENQKTIAELRAKLDNAASQRELAVTKAVQEKDLEIANKQEEIIKLNSSIDIIRKENRLNEEALRRDFEAQIKGKDSEIAFYKDYKIRQSTKMLGESLEQHCEISFNQIRATAFPRAYFEKDNNAKAGTKGDFIFKDYTEDGLEYISIMFEMKNEMDETATKKKNEDFFDKLDKDRNKKNCEYAILVSMLEADNELYNTGIVDVSYRYPKMYVVRPQFFITIITLLRDAAMNSVAYKNQLAAIQNQNLDIANFEAEMESFKQAFGNNFRLAVGHYEKAIDSIEKTISSLEKTRDELKKSMQQLNWANTKAEDLTIKKLTKNSPLLKAQFEALE